MFQEILTINFPPVGYCGTREIWREEGRILIIFAISEEGEARVDGKWDK